jgi:hypothetical protein
LEKSLDTAAKPPPIENPAYPTRIQEASSHSPPRRLKGNSKQISKSIPLKSTDHLPFSTKAFGESSTLEPIMLRQRTEVVYPFGQPQVNRSDEVVESLCRGY